MHEMKEKSLYDIMNQLFHPNSIVIVGASENQKSMGSRTLKLIQGFGYKGSLYAINPRGESSGGVPGYQRVVDISQSVDLCIIAVPAAQVIHVVKDCVEKGITVAQILTSGFGETGSTGEKLEQELLRVSKGKVRLVGPNSLGIHSPVKSISFVSSADKKVGRVAIATQSGGLGIDMIHQAKSRGLQLGKLISVGNSLDLNPVDFLEYFAQDVNTDVIGLYLEGIKDGRQFFETLKKVAFKKPVVILKGGRTELGALTAASHTGSLAAGHNIWKAAMRQGGAIEANNVEEFLSLLTSLQNHVPRINGNGIALVGNGGGSTVLATDLLQEKGMTLAKLGQKTIMELQRLPKPAGSIVGNPTDIPAGAMDKAGGEALGTIMNCLIKDPKVSGIIAHFNLLPFINYSDPNRFVKGLSSALLSLRSAKKPIYISLRSVSDPSIEKLRTEVLKACHEANLPCFLSTSEAINSMEKISEWMLLKNLNEDLSEFDSKLVDNQDVEKAKEIIKELRLKGYKSLPQIKTYKILDLYGIPHPPLSMAQTSFEAMNIAEKVGFPVVLKIESPDILHKSDSGGVQLGLNSRREVASAFDKIIQSVKNYDENARIEGVIVQSMSSNPVQEMICGLKYDNSFGMTLVLGLGGVLVEILNDISIKILPLSTHDYGSMWKELVGSHLLTGFRGRDNTDIQALELLLKKVELLGQTIPEIEELDLNPVMLMSEGKGLQVVDCRILIK